MDRSRDVSAANTAAARRVAQALLGRVASHMFSLAPELSPTALLAMTDARALVAGDVAQADDLPTELVIGASTSTRAGVDLDGRIAS